MEKQVENITEDGKVTKQIIQEGEGDQPTEGYQVKLIYIGRLQDGTEFDRRDNKEDPFEFILGENKVIKGWELCVGTMKKGERAILTIDSEYGYGKDKQEKIPENSTLQFEVELLDFEKKKKQKWDYDSAGRYEEARKFKDEGNNLFKQGKYEEARKQYEQGLDYIEHEYKNEIIQFRATLFLNISASSLKLKEFSKAVENANKCIEIDKYNVKAYFRRAQAYAEYAEFEKAAQDLEYALSIEPFNQDLKNESKRVNDKIKKASQKDKAIFSKLFQESYYEKVYKTPEYHDSKNPIVYLDIKIGVDESVPPERIIIELFKNLVPKTAENFRVLCTGERGIASCGKPLHYKGTKLFRIVPEQLIQGGDIDRNDGTSGESIYGETFEDENFKIKHTRRGLLSMANSGIDTNNSQFIITLKKLDWLDDLHVVFGAIISNEEFISKLENVKCQADKPEIPIRIVDSGEIKN